MRWYSDTTQIAWVCGMLVQGEEISHACEFEAVKGWRLAAIIHNLIKKYRWPIAHRDGKHNVRYYRLQAGVNVKVLQNPKSYQDYLEKQKVLKEKGAATPSSKSDSNKPKSKSTDK